MRARSRIEMVDFEAILHQPFRWPTTGDKLFAASPQRDGNAFISSNPRDRLVLMMSGYKRAADILVRQATDQRPDRDFLVFPIIFNYRQYLELAIKYLVAIYGPTVGVKAIWDSHNLKDLWAALLEVLHGYGVGEVGGVDTVVGELVSEFARVDPGSFAYRYPVDNKGNAISISFEHIDLSALANTFNGLEGYFTGCDGYLDSLKSA
jgi:hypothetical protein